MPDPHPRHPTLLISWAHADPGWPAEQVSAWRDAVLRLSAVLRDSGIDADLDLYHLSADVDWTRWGPRRVAECDYVLIVVSEGWRTAWEGRGNPSSGAGAAAEADVLRSTYATNRDVFHRKVRLVLLPGTTSSDVPDGLHGVPRFPLTSIDDTGVRDLLRSLTRQPEYVKGALGPLPILSAQTFPPAPARPMTTTEDEAVPTQADAARATTASPGQRNALAKAKEYLTYTAFSRNGLAEQLAHDGFSSNDSEYAVANVGASWDEEAAKKAANYLEYTSFSQSGLMEQLVFDGFTQTEAESGALRAYR